MKTMKKRRIRLCAVLVGLIAFLLGGCSDATDYWWVGDGRGDWTLELCSGYAISKINSRQIALIHRENPESRGGSFVIENYHVVGYRLHEPYLCVEGIRTAGRTATDEELTSAALSYCLVDTASGQVFEPTESYGKFAKICGIYGLDTDEEWTKPTVSLTPPAAYSSALSEKRRVLCFGAAAGILAVVGKGSPVLFCVLGFLLTILLG